MSQYIASALVRVRALDSLLPDEHSHYRKQCYELNHVYNEPHSH